MRESSTVIGAAVFFRSVLALLLGISCGAQAQRGTLRILHDFGGSGDGFHPYGSLVFDTNGSLYGTAPDGPGTGCEGDQGCGVVFKVKPNPDGTWAEGVIHYFSGADGANPTGGLVFDRHGNLFGTTYAGGIGDFGTVFKLTPTFNSGWVLSTLYAFPASGANGAFPIAGVSFDQVGHLYGTAYEGGPDNYGVVYELGPLTVFAWYEILLHGFGAAGDGRLPYSGLIFDASGNAYGTTDQGGANNAGTVFKLTPNRLRFGWTETVLYSFTGQICGESADGAGPVAGVTFDSAGNLYGTTECGGAYGRGTVFKLTHNADDTWTESVLYAFQGGNDGSQPTAPVTFDDTGNLYGTTCCGGQLTDGTIFKLTPFNGSWTETTLYSFSYSDGASPGPLIFDSAGNLYGTTNSGGTYGPNGGVAFEFTP